MYGRVSRSTFGSCVWLKTELAWSQKHDASASVVSSIRQSTDTSTDSWKPLIPMHPYLFPYTMVLFVSGFNWQGCHSSLKPQERAERRLIPASIWIAMKQVVISLIPYTPCLCKRPTKTALSHRHFLSALVLVLKVILSCTFIKRLCSVELWPGFLQLQSVDGKSWNPVEGLSGPLGHIYPWTTCIAWTLLPLTTALIKLRLEHKT